MILTKATRTGAGFSNKPQNAHCRSTRGTQHERRSGQAKQLIPNASTEQHSKSWMHTVLDIKAKAAPEQLSI